VIAFARFRYLIIWYVTTLHIGWGLLLLLSGSAIGPTAVGTQVRLFGYSPFTFDGGRYIAALALLAASALALWGIKQTVRYWDDLLPAPYTHIFYFLPQQVLLSMSGFGAIYHSYLGQFLDGVQRDSSFILADQLAYILALVFHVLATYTIFGRRRIG
jgi:hypothetical protein